MASKDIPVLVSAAGRIGGFVDKLARALRKRGISDEQIRSLFTEDGDVAVGKTADALAEMLSVCANKGSLDSVVLPRVVHGFHEFNGRMYPDDGTEFELTLDFDAPENQLDEILRAEGYYPDGRRFTGQKRSGVQTRRFKLVRVGDCRNLSEVRKKLAQYGDIPEGQWREAFKSTYPNLPYGDIPIGFADFSLSGLLPELADSESLFPSINGDGVSRLCRANYGFIKSWRWLVSAGK